MLFAQFQWAKKNLLLPYVKKRMHQIGTNNVICKEIQRNHFFYVIYIKFSRPIVDDATIKLTVYQQTKSALSKGDFIGRAYVPLRDLNDYDRVHTKYGIIELINFSDNFY
jgi:hypothetical protein